MRKKGASTASDKPDVSCLIYSAVCPICQSIKCHLDLFCLLCSIDRLTVFGRIIGLMVTVAVVVVAVIGGPLQPRVHYATSYLWGEVSVAY